MTVHIPKPDFLTRDDNDVTLALIGHSTVVINFFGTRIVTDPVFSKRVGVHLFGQTIGPKRYTPPACQISDIPQIDILLLSHCHMDHCDLPSLNAITKKFSHKIEGIGSPGSSQFVKHFPFAHRQELDRKEQTVVNGIEITGWEVHHRGARVPYRHYDRASGQIENGLSFNAYVLKKNDVTIVFGGDTDYTEGFKELSDVTIALMPIGAYKGRFQKDNHCTPEEALLMAKDMGTTYFIPIHFGTFHLAYEGPEEPMKRLKSSIVNYPFTLGLDQIGQTFVLSDHKAVKK